MRQSRCARSIASQPGVFAIPLSSVFASRPALGLISALAFGAPVWAPSAVANAEPASSQASPEEHWELETSDAEAGWTLYTTPVPGSDYPRYRLISQTSESVERVARALRMKLSDVKYMQDGFDRKILSRGDGFMINYVRMDIPIVSDRDVVLETRWWTDTDTAAYHVAWAPPAGEVPPVPDGVSRIESRGAWEVTPRPGGGSHLVYTQHSELGTSMPAWLIGRLMNAQIISEYTTLNEILDSDLPDVASPPLAEGDAAARVD